MQRLRLVFQIVIAIIILSSSNVWAFAYEISFSASNFTSWGESPAPYSPVTGSLVFDSDSINSPINTLNSIELSIGRYVFDIGEVFAPPTGTDANLVVGLINLEEMHPNTNDIWLLWNSRDLVPIEFGYTLAEITDGWYTRNFDFFNISETTIKPVPEPSTFLLLGGGLAGLVFVARRRRKE